jgi:serine phosphatase RsbU (regulator of sigma subunit)
MLEVANAVLCESQGPLAERFCTVACAVVRPGTPTTLDVASAGHPVPLVLRADGSIDELDCRGVALGLVTNPGLRSTQTTVGRQEAVIFYTDGLTEARDRAGRFFGEVGLRDALAACRGLTAEGIARSLLRSVEAFSAGRIADDLALLVVRVG